MLDMTEQAVEAIRGIVQDSELGPNGGLRISGANGANGDAALEFELASEAQEGDHVVRDGGAVVFLDETAAAVLAGKTLDVHAHGDHFHFSIDEPEEAARRLPGLAADKSAARSPLPRFAIAVSSCFAISSSYTGRWTLRNTPTGVPPCVACVTRESANASDGDSCSASCTRTPSSLARHTSIDPSLRWRSAFSSSLPQRIG